MVRKCVMRDVLRKVDKMDKSIGRKSTLRGIQFLVDEDGRKKGVLIDFKQNSQLWEDFYDVAVAKSRAKESRESLDTVRRRLGIKSGCR